MKEARNTRVLRTIPSYLGLFGENNVVVYTFRVAFETEKEVQNEIIKCYED